MEPAENKVKTEKCQQTWKPSTSCSWNNAQPSSPASNKQETAAQSSSSTSSSTSSSSTGKCSDKSCPSIQQSSSQFFYFLRLMQLFPETHPATLHTVLCLCNNNFFYAVDKLLYARKCKSLYSQNQRNYRRCPYERSPFCSHDDSCRSRREKTLDVKVAQVGTRICTEGTVFGNVSKTETQFSEDQSRASTSSKCGAIPVLESAVSREINSEQTQSSKVKPTREENSENYSIHNQSIIQNSDIIII